MTGRGRPRADQQMAGSSAILPRSSSCAALMLICANATRTERANLARHVLLRVSANPAQPLARADPACAREWVALLFAGPLSSQPLGRISVPGVLAGNRDGRNLLVYRRSVRLRLWVGSSGRLATEESIRRERPKIQSYHAIPLLCCSKPSSHDCCFLSRPYSSR